MKPKVIVLGAGVGGCGTALELADAGYDVVLIEMLDQLLAGTSQRMPCRLGLGFHYIDVATAIKNLHAVLALMKKYPGFRLGEEFTDSHRLRRGRYFVVENSQFSTEEILNSYGQLKDTYAQLCDEDPSNQIFGAPENFFTLLEPSQYPEVSSESKTILGIETAECILNWPKIKAFIIEKILQHPRIKIKLSSEVTDIHARANNKYRIEYKHANEINRLDTDIVVNCTWHNIERLNSRLGIKESHSSRAQRLKAMVEVTIPDELSETPSALFCFGPHAAFTNLGDGRGFLTYEPVTNVESSTSTSLPARMTKLMSPQLRDQDEANNIGEKIIAGAAKYIPALAQAKLRNVHFGIVRSFGDANIFSSESNIHARRESGVEQPAPNWIVNGSMKLTYFVMNAKEVLRMVEEIHSSQYIAAASAQAQPSITVQSEDKYNLAVAAPVCVDHPIFVC
jgi:hypothetical protein